MAEKKKSIYRKPILFKFNLLSKQNEEDIQTLEERDDSTLYAMVLVFSGIFIFFILNLIQLIVIQSRINSIQTRIDDTVAEITTYNDVRALYGEIFQKSNLLREPLLNDIKLTRLIEISSLMTQDDGTIVSYGRVPAGGFSLTVEVDTEENARNILNRAEEIEEVIRPYITVLSGANVIEGLQMSMTFDILQNNEEI